MYPVVHCCTTYNSQNMKATQMSINRWMDKEVVLHIHNGILLSHKRNTFESVLMRWINLETIIQSEVSQKEKDKYHILRHIYGIQKNSAEDFICRAAMERHREQIYGHGEREGQGEMYGKSNMETYITICKVDSKQEFVVLSGNSNRGSGSTQKSGMEREMGGRFKRMEIYIPMADSS